MSIFNLVAVDNFEALRAVSPRSVSEEAVASVRDLDEREEMEPWIQGILFDTNRNGGIGTDLVAGQSSVRTLQYRRVSHQGISLAR